MGQQGKKGPENEGKRMKGKRVNGRPGNKEEKDGEAGNMVKRENGTARRGRTRDM